MGRNLMVKLKFLIIAVLFVLPLCLLGDRRKSKKKRVHIPINISVNIGTTRTTKPSTKPKRTTTKVSKKSKANKELERKLQEAYNQLNELNAKLQKTSTTGAVNQKISGQLVDIAGQLDVLTSKVTAEPTVTSTDQEAVNQVYKNINQLNDTLEKQKQQISIQQQASAAAQQKQEELKDSLSAYITSDANLTTAYENYRQIFNPNASYTSEEVAEYKNELETSWNNYLAALNNLNRALLDNGIDRPIQLNKYYSQVITGALKL
jgi:chromosome segregation ATPase